MKKTKDSNPKKKISLTEKVTLSLRKDIINGKLPAGSTLPTEPELTKQFDVSRTVIREAVAVLKAERLLEPKQGAGVFVLQPPEKKSHGLIFDVNFNQISDILEILELRMAVEIEAAALAAERCTTANQAKIYEALRNMTSEIDNGGLAEKADYEFHKRIFEATNNSKYCEFHLLLGQRNIPRSQLCIEHDPEKHFAYMKQIQNEHKVIYEAIALHDADKARQNMREHLTQSLIRYQSLLKDFYL